MDVLHHCRGQSFVWDEVKAEANLAKHGVRFESACEVFFDPLLTLTDCGTEEEDREAALGETLDRTLLLWCMSSDCRRFFVLFPQEKPPGRREVAMKTMTERIQLRLRKDRPTTTVSVRLPQDVVDDLEEIAPVLGFSGAVPLMRTYIGRGLRADLQELEHSPLTAIAESLRRQGVAEEQIAAAMAEARLTSVSAAG